MTWHARLDIDYTREGDRTVARHTHEGPLRVLRTLYPEGEGVAHNVLVHPPSGIVGGDTLDLHVRVGERTHAFITTPGAARFYRSEGQPALQRASLEVEAGGRLEWLPLETLAYSSCIAENRVMARLAAGAEMIGWDVTSLALPASGQPFARGTYLQHVEVAGHWLDRGRIDADDPLLMDWPLGLAGRRCFATLFFSCGDPVREDRRDRLLELANGAIGEQAGSLVAGATAP